MAQPSKISGTDQPPVTKAPTDNRPEGQNPPQQLPEPRKLNYFSDSEKKCLKPEMLDDYAQNRAKDFIPNRVKDSKENLKTTQMRRFYDELKAIERKIMAQKNIEEQKRNFERDRPLIVMFKAKAVYAEKRGVAPRAFTQFIFDHVASINDLDDFKGFLKVFEAVVAFHKFFSPEKIMQKEIQSMKLINTYLIKGQIKILTGLHIGAGKDAVEIGGVDSPVVKNPYTGEPYIPGSSLKGKLRCLMEWVTGCVETSGKTWEGGGETDPIKLASDPILRIFGTTKKEWKAGPTRLTVRDAYLNKEWKDQIIERGLPFTEEKFENNIDRIQGKAGVGIRKTERVPAGAVFDIQMVYRVFDMSDEGKTDIDNLNNLYEIIRLLEQDALGGSGSRGYGRIKFTNITQDGQDIQSQFEAIDPSNLVKRRKVA